MTNMNIQERKDQIIELISELFGDTDADELEQKEALEEIASEADSKAYALKEQIKNRCNP